MRARVTGNASGVRPETLKGMGKENADADRAKKQHHTRLDHRTSPFVPRRDKTAWLAEQSKEIDE
jgi:hypothetical protein